jgi:hypothetical protein
MKRYYFPDAMDLDNCATVQYDREGVSFSIGNPEIDRPAVILRHDDCYELATYLEYYADPFDRPLPDIPLLFCFSLGAREINNFAGSNPVIDIKLRDEHGNPSTVSLSPDTATSLASVLIFHCAALYYSIDADDDDDGDTLVDAA